MEQFLICKNPSYLWLTLIQNAVFCVPLEYVILIMTTKTYKL